MAIRLSEVLRAQIRTHGMLDFPYECCGALLGTIDKGIKVVRALMPAKNVHEEGHERRFEFDSQTMLIMAKQEASGGLRVLGSYHSHPNHPAIPSAIDLEAALPKLSYVILSVMDGRPAEMTCWTLNSSETAFEEEAILLHE